MTRRRTFTGAGRYPDTPPTVTAELNAEGTDYLLLPDSPSPHRSLLAALQILLTESPTPLNRRELLARWPGDAPRPALPVPERPRAKTWKSWSGHGDRRRATR